MYCTLQYCEALCNAPGHSNKGEIALTAGHPRTTDVARELLELRAHPFPLPDVVTVLDASPEGLDQRTTVFPLTALVAAAGGLGTMILAAIIIGALIRFVVYLGG
jgi:hypothetical protein